MDARIEKMNTARAAAHAIFEKAKAEGRELTPEEYAAKDLAIAEFNGLKKTLDAEKEAAAMEFSQIIQPREPQGGNKGGEDRARHNRTQFNKFLRSGAGALALAAAAMTVEEAMDRQEFVITTGTDSGSLVPRSVETPQIVRRAWNPWLNAMALTGQPVIGGMGTETINLPVMDDSSVSGDAPSESATADVAADPTTTSISLGATLNSSKSVWISNTQAQAVGYDLAGYVMPILDKRIELIQGSAWTTKALTHQGAGNTVTTATTTGLTYAEFIAFWHKLSVQFRQDAVWVISDGLLQVLETLTDSQNRPLLSDPLVEGAVKTLKGRPVVIDISLAAPAAAAVSGILVSGASLHARICDNRRVAVYKNIPTFPDQQGYRQFVNSDFDISPGYAFLKHAAS